MHDSTQNFTTENVPALPKREQYYQGLVDGERIAFNLHSCFYRETLTAYGAPELTASFCRLDDVMYEEASPYMSWDRTMTLGQGGTHCDFCFTHVRR